jgi:hypothetical protein
MERIKRAGLVWGTMCVAVLVASGLCTVQLLAEPQAAQGAAAAGAARQVVGVIKAISGDSITLKPDTGADVNVTVKDATRIVSVAPGQTDLKAAKPIQASDLQVGDRILVRTVSPNGPAIDALGIIAMKRSDLDAKRASERDDWQKRGIGGLVSAVDAGTGTLTITVAAAGGPKAVTVETSKATVVRRYAPNSVQFDDATASSASQIKVGDQLRARGTRNADGSSFAAEEIVSGSFRNIAGTINAMDAGAGALTVMDLATKKPVVVKVTAQSQVWKLPPQVAQGIAARMKGRGAATGDAAGGAAGGGAADSARPGGGGGRGGGGAADLQQILGRTPPGSLMDLQKGDAVMIVSTEGSDAGGVTAITLVGGVEPILTSPNGQGVTLSPWALGGGGGEGDAAQ